MSKTVRKKNIGIFEVIFFIIIFLTYPAMLIGLACGFVFNKPLKTLLLKYPACATISYFAIIAVAFLLSDYIVLAITVHVREFFLAVQHIGQLPTFLVNIQYTVFDYIIIGTGSLALICYLIRQQIRDEKLNNAGIKNFDTVIDDMTPTSNNTTNNIKERTYIGKNRQNKKVYCNDDSKHIFVCGTTGSGKTTALSNFIYSAVTKDYGGLIIDGKGDIGDNSILQITQNLCEQYHKKLYVINMTDMENSHSYNPFKNASPTIVKDMLINMSDWSEEHYKANTERYIQLAVKLMQAASINITYTTLIETLSPETLRGLSANLAKDNVITKNEHVNNDTVITNCEKIIGGAIARFATLAESELQHIFNDNGIDIYGALQEKSIILFVLNPLLYPETSTNLGRLILIDAKKAVSQLFQGHVKNRNFFIFDELNVYASRTLLDLVNKSRSANVTCLLACQSISDLVSAIDEDFKNQVIENCNNFIFMRQNTSKNAEECAEIIGTQEKIQMTYQMDEHTSTDKGSARRVREFIVHPDTIKNFGLGECAYLSKDSHTLESYVKIHLLNKGA